MVSWNSKTKLGKDSKKSSLNDLEKSINYFFNDNNLLNMALTHRSYGRNHNERLEFLGDSVLNLATTFFLFNHLNDSSEGNLSRLRANLVCQNTLHQIAKNLSLFDYINLGEGELKTGSNMLPSILADSLEALLGAIFIDAGYTKTIKVIEFMYEPILKDINLRTLGKDSKSELQEILQGKKLSVPRYEVASKSGADHNQTFRVKCTISELNISTYGFGSSRKIAETHAASKTIIEVKQKLDKT